MLMGEIYLGHTQADDAGEVSNNLRWSDVNWYWPAWRLAVGKLIIGGSCVCLGGGRDMRGSCDQAECCMYNVDMSMPMVVQHACNP